MSRYMLKFSKTGNLRYISHLDMLRLFQRTFKRAGIKLAYSQGFNPHPKMSFAQPLSLGYESTGEYIEIETENPYENTSLIDNFNIVAPVGLNISISVNLVDEVNVAKKTIAAAVTYASYHMTGNIDTTNLYELTEHYPKDEGVSNTFALDAFYSQEKIIGNKSKKKKIGRNKTQRIIEAVDIKPMIAGFKGVVEGSQILLEVLVMTGSNGNINPEVIAGSLCDYMKVSFEKHRWSITRRDIFFTDDRGDIITLLNFKG